MLKNIQARIILIFLSLGVIMILAMGCINYMGLQVILGNMPNNIQDYNIILEKYQGQITAVTVIMVLLFSFICIGVRSFYYPKDYFNNYKAY